MGDSHKVNVKSAVGNQTQTLIELQHQRRQCQYDAPGADGGLARRRVVSVAGVSWQVSASSRRYRARDSVRISSTRRHRTSASNTSIMVRRSWLSAVRLANFFRIVVIQTPVLLPESRQLSSQSSHISLILRLKLAALDRFSFEAVIKIHEIVQLVHDDFDRDDLAVSGLIQNDGRPAISYSPSVADGRPAISYSPSVADAV
ncbi:hypothetical protein J6590_082713 [Homalodisca vitripennis]|nr:hypothetical protein J6590_082713 [Homalodisca vitripennis]